MSTSNIQLLQLKHRATRLAENVDPVQGDEWIGKFITNGGYREAIMACRMEMMRHRKSTPPATEAKRMLHTARMGNLSELLDTLNAVQSEIGSGKKRTKATAKS